MSSTDPLPPSVDVGFYCEYTYFTVVHNQRTRLDVCKHHGGDDMPFQLANGLRVNKPHKVGVSKDGQGLALNYI